MNTYPLEQLIKMWGLENITPEIAIGQALLHIREQNERIELIEKQIESLTITLRAVEGALNERA